MRSIGIDFCCNDPDDGLFAGRIEGVQLYFPDGDPLFELASRRDPAPMLTRLDQDSIRISGKRWPIEGEKEYVGNWCWNRYWFRQPIAVDLILWLQRRGAFNLDCGEYRFATAWRWKDGFAQFRPFLEQQIEEIARGKRNAGD